MLKMKVAVSQDRRTALETQLQEHGITVCDESDLVLREENRFADVLTVREPKTGSYCRVAVERIVVIESYGKSVEVHTTEATYLAAERLYQLEAMLDPEDFLRISNSVIISRRKVEKIQPSFSRKFVLILLGNRTVDVTRSYYDIFRDSFGI